MTRCLHTSSVWTQSNRVLFRESLRYEVGAWSLKAGGVSVGGWLPASTTMLSWLMLGLSLCHGLLVLFLWEQISVLLSFLHFKGPLNLYAWRGFFFLWFHALWCIGHICVEGKYVVLLLRGAFTQRCHSTKQHLQLMKQSNVIDVQSPHRCTHAPPVWNICVHREPGEPPQL